MEKDKKYYWLRLKRDFFKRHDIRIIESMPGGKEIVLFYLKLLCESVDHEGRLRFSESIPYTREMLASLTDTEMDIVDASMDILLDLELITYDDSKTYVMTGIDKLIGSETYWAEKKRQQRELDNVQPMSNECPTNVQPMSNVSNQCPSKSKSKSIEIDKEIDKEKEKSSRFAPPSLDEVRAYCQERNNNVDPEAFVDFYTSKGWKVGSNPMKDWKACVRTWEKRKTTEKQPVKNSFNNFTGRKYTPEQLIEWEREMARRVST